MLLANSRGQIVHSTILLFYPVKRFGGIGLIARQDNMSKRIFHIKLCVRPNIVPRLHSSPLTLQSWKL